MKMNSEIVALILGAFLFLISYLLLDMKIYMGVMCAIWGFKLISLWVR